jgi:predicted protein tyrosine phosphatase
MKKLIVEYEKLNLIDASEYMVIYGELKNFFINDDEGAISVLDFLQSSMRRETLIEDSRISQDMICYYLKRGRCIILLDALDEVDKDKRYKLHGTIVQYFKNQNPNNKVCITSRARGFLPEKGVEVYEIGALNAFQIREYVENIIKLGKFDKKDKESFLQQTQMLVDKGFLNSFLVLSLLINIYKAERELPENKLELYQKCFEYISNKREKEKSQEKYDWKLISTLMKDNTFMELANLCLPNNSEVDKNTIKERLVEIYKMKYVSENETETAIEQFLIFCSDRTELFVPASGEDCYKFFHRSFFEYFYSQYIFTRMGTAEEIYDAWRVFDVDSEVFELTLAMFKQKNEIKYQEIIGYLLEKMHDLQFDRKEKVNVINMFILCLQVIDDEFYKKRFVSFLNKESAFCVKNVKEIHNQRIVSDMVISNQDYSDMICKKYKDAVLYEAVELFANTYPEVEAFFKQHKLYRDSVKKTKTFGMQFQPTYCSNFYSRVFWKSNSLKQFFSRLTISDISSLGKKNGVSRKNIQKLQGKYKKFWALKQDVKEAIEITMFEME